MDSTAAALVAASAGVLVFGGCGAACAAPQVCACVRRAEGVWRASWSHRCLRAGGYQRLTSAFQSQADGAVQGARGMRLDEARVRREVRLPSAARVRKKMPERRLHMGPPEPRVFRASGGSW